MPKCRHCKTRLAEGEGVRVGLSLYCSHTHAIDWAAEKSQKDFKKDCNKDRKEAKQNTNSHQLKITQDSFNKMRRLDELLWFQERGIVPYCISCLKPLGNDIWCCGHYKSRGANSYLRFDRKNTALQHNRGCNSALSGNIEGAMNTVGYKKGLKHRYGEEVGSQIIEYCENAPRVREWKNEELKEMRTKFNIEIRKLQGLLDY